MSVLDDIFGTQIDKANAPELIPVKSIRTDGGTQMRALIHPVTIEEYRDALLDGVKFPPILVFYDGQDYWLADGFHRLRAHVLAYPMPGGPGELIKPKIEAEVRAGTRRDAILYAAGANGSHGLRRSNEDKRRAVMALLQDEEWAKWSNEEIGRRCHVSGEMVRKLRPPILQPLEDKPITRTVQRGDSVFEQALPRRKELPPAAPITRPAPPKETLIKYAGLYQLQGLVKAAYPEFYREENEQRAAVQDMRACANVRGGGFWRMLVERITADDWSYADHILAQAISNVAEEIEATQIPPGDKPMVEWTENEWEGAQAKAALDDRNAQRREAAMRLLENYRATLASGSEYSELTGDFVGTIPVVEGLRKMIAGLERLVEALQ